MDLLPRPPGYCLPLVRLITPEKAASSKGTPIIILFSPLQIMKSCGLKISFLLMISKVHYLEKFMFLSIEPLHVLKCFLHYMNKIIYSTWEHSKKCKCKEVVPILNEIKIRAVFSWFLCDIDIHKTQQNISFMPIKYPWDQKYSFIILIQKIYSLYALIN